MAECQSIWSFHPEGRGCDLLLGLIAGIPGPGIAHPHQHAHVHVAVADGLARETHFSHEVPHVQHYQLRLGYLLRLAVQVLYAAGGAPRVASADVHDVDARVLLYRENQSLVTFDVEGPNAFDFQLGHSLLLSFAGPELSGCHTTKAPANVCPGRPSQRFGRLPPGHLAYHRGPSEDLGRGGETTHAESARDRDGGAGKGDADRDGCRAADYGGVGRVESEHNKAQ